MSDQLKNATASVHQSLEAFLIPLIKETHTVPGYLKLLRMFYGFYKPLEDAIEKQPVAALLPDWGERRKAALILDDIRHLGGDPAFPVSTEVPRPASAAEAFGALYVLEGSTLGGLIITKMLKRNLHTEHGAGFSFFNGYGEQTHEKWESFRSVLQTYTEDPQQYPAVEEAAYLTFTLMKKWAEQTYRYERAKEKL